MSLKWDATGWLGCQSDEVIGYRDPVKEKDLLLLPRDYKAGTHLSSVSCSVKSCGLLAFAAPSLKFLRTATSWRFRQRFFFLVQFYFLLATAVPCVKAQRMQHCSIFSGYYHHCSAAVGSFTGWATGTQLNQGRLCSQLQSDTYLLVHV